MSPYTADNGPPQRRSSVHRGTRSSDPEESTFHLYLNFCVHGYCEYPVSFSLFVPLEKLGYFLLTLPVLSTGSITKHTLKLLLSVLMFFFFLLWNLGPFAQKYRIKTCFIEPYVSLTLLQGAYGRRCFRGHSVHGPSLCCCCCCCFKDGCSISYQFLQGS